MIELEMVRRMARRGLYLTPAVAFVAFVAGGPEAVAAAGIGIGIALANLWLAGRIIGGLAENRPGLLLVGAFAAFVLAFVLLGAAAFAINRIDGLDVAVTGLVFVGAHLVLTTWEAADRFLRLPPDEAGASASPSPGIRSDAWN